MKRYNEFFNIGRLHELGYDDMGKYLRDRMEAGEKKRIMEELNISLPTVHKWLTLYDIPR